MKLLLITICNCQHRLYSNSAQKMGAEGSCVIPARLRHALTECSGDLELLEVTLPATFTTARHSGLLQSLLNNGSGDSMDAVG